MGLKLMCVVAHPDDECFAFGGALALAAARGIETYVLCLTDGQAATARGAAENGEQLGRIRREEFAASCKVLGVTHHELLDYQDGAWSLSSFRRRLVGWWNVYVVSSPILSLPSVQTARSTRMPIT